MKQEQITIYPKKFNMNPKDYIFGEYMKHGIVTDVITGKKEKRVVIVYPKYSWLATIIIYAFILIALPIASLQVRTISSPNVIHQQR